MGVPSLNDLAVDGTLNTTNQPKPNHKNDISAPDGPLNGENKAVPIVIVYDLALLLSMTYQFQSRSGKKLTARIYG